MKGLVCLLVGKTFKVGDPRPPDASYTDWHDWAGVQYRGGLRQRYCPGCQKWLFPQEFKGHACKE